MPALPLDPATAGIIARQLAPFDAGVIYLFGSRALGRARPDSDFDIAFLPVRPCAAQAVFEAAQNLARDLNAEVHLVDLSRATTVFRKEILRTGLVLAEARPADRARFEMQTLVDYARLNEERPPVLAALGKPPPES